MMQKAVLQPERGSIVYKIDPSDTLVKMSGDWDDFARKNDAPHLIAESVQGRGLWDFISDETVRHLYKQILKQVRAGKVMKFDFRCDAPHQRRRLRMTIRPCENGDVEFGTRTLVVTPRPPGVAVLCDPTETNPRIVACSWCNKIKTEDEAWVELEQAVEMLQLFTVVPPFRLSHGICPVCKKRVLDEIHLS